MLILIIYLAFCLHVVQGRMKGVPNETRSHSWRFGMDVNFGWKKLALKIKKKMIDNNDFTCEWNFQFCICLLMILFFDLEKDVIRHQNQSKKKGFLIMDF